jgi:hypothetical protein
MDRESFWHSDDDDDVIAEYLAEHSYGTSFDPTSGEYVIGIGNEDRIPTIEEMTKRPCLICGTPVDQFGDAGWRHLVGLKERDGCTMAWPQ